MSYRFDVLLSTLEHIQLEFEANKKFCSARIFLDSKNLTRDEITLLRGHLGLEPLEEWYPRVMREIVLFEGFAPILKTKDVARIQREFGRRYSVVTGHVLNHGWWSDKSSRPKYNGKHAKDFASNAVLKMQQSLVVA